MRVKKSELVGASDQLAGAWDRDHELPDWNVQRSERR
jgi:hypothetical protein